LQRKASSVDVVDAVSHVLEESIDTWACEGLH
jgi:hypothetical protein